VVPASRVIDEATEAATPLRELFTDLIAFALVFRETCETRPWTAADLRNRLTVLIEAQERRARGSAVAWESYLEARFAVLAWIDELVLNSPWPQRSQWQHLMLTYYATLNAGNQFFERLERLPAAARDIREIYYYCLALGFEGKFALAGNPNALRELRRTLYHQLVAADGVRSADAHLFPEAYRRPPPPASAPARHWGAAVWVALISLVPVALFIVYLLVLRGAADARIAQLSQPVAPAVIVTPEWHRSLVEELRRRGIDARDTSRGVVVTLPGVSFEVNRSDLSPSGERSVREVAAALMRHAPERVVAVEGHASREKGTLDEQNQRLSADRAQRVADALLVAGLRRDRVTARGLGSSTPVDSNDTEEGRRRNRRVEMIVEKPGN
jgi:type VI secretion system protein ImpK